MNNRLTVFSSVCLLAIAILLFSGVTTRALEDFSLSTKLSLSAIPMPCSLTDEIQTETPCEKAFLKWDITSILDLDVRIAEVDYFVDTSLSISHPEHLVLGLETDIGELTVRPEIWFAVPFEGVVDANNTYNTVVVPPGDPLFVAGRATASFTAGNFRFKNIFVYEDINFPGTGYFDGMNYGPQSQSFKVGDIFYASGRTEDGIYFSSQTSFCARGSTSVKGYSAPGGVDPDCENEINERLTIGGIRFGDYLSISETINVDIEEETTATSRTGISFTPFDWSRFGTSLTTDIVPLEFEMNAIRLGLSFDVDPFRFNVRFNDIETFELNTITASFHDRFTLGTMNGAVSANTTFQNERGITGVSMSLFVSQGTVSTSTSVSFAQYDESLQFSYLNNRISLRLSPFTFTASPSFGRDGLRRLAITTGVMF